MDISARDLDFKELNSRIKKASGDVIVNGCFGQRFIGSGMRGKSITINGTPGNALGVYLDGAVITVNGNAQDAVGDTMNDGSIIIYGSAGDALGYAMRGGSIFVRDSAGYRAGIHMKEYKDKVPSIVIGACAGSFLGEYQAGGTIVVLGLGTDEVPVGNFTGTGMHGGRIYIRTNKALQGLPKQVVSNVATPEEIEEIRPLISRYAQYFGADGDEILNSMFYVLKPNAKNPYKQLYTAY